MTASNGYKRQKIDDLTLRKSLGSTDDTYGTAATDMLAPLRNKRTVSSGYVSKQKLHAYGYNRRVQSMSTYTHNNHLAVDDSAGGTYPTILENIKRRLLSTSRMVWKKLGSYDDNSILYEELNESEISVNYGQDESSQENIDIDEFKVNDPILPNNAGWKNWTPASLPTTQETRYNETDTSIREPYGSAFVRRKKIQTTYDDICLPTILRDQSDEITYLRMIFQSDEEIPQLLKDERERQLKMMQIDPVVDSRLKRSILELTDKIKDIWIDSKGKIQGNDDDVVIFKEIKTIPIPKTKIAFKKSFKFNRYLSKSFEEQKLYQRYNNYLENFHNVDVVRRKNVGRYNDQISPDLSSLDIQKVMSIFGKSGNNILNKSGNIQISQRDFQTLNEGRWLNDTIIEFYMLNIENSTPKTATFNSFFYSNLSERGYQGVRRWMKRKKLVISELEKVFVPINLNRSHWVLSVIDISKKSIFYIDSLSHGPSPASFSILENLQRYLYEESNRQLGNDFELICLNSPQQNNGFDCGIYLCMNALFISKNLPLTYDTSEANKMRPYIGKLVLSS